jgi:hypothetical protein
MGFPTPLHNDASSKVDALNAFRWTDALARLPNTNVSLAWSSNNPGYQSGAIAGVVIAARLGWFGGYDWVIRVNPDVVFEDSKFLETHLRQQNTSAVLAQCKTCSQAGIVTHTDFFAARPLAMDHTKWASHKNAEVASTHVFQATVDRHRAVTFPKGTDTCQCRVMNHGIVHQHDFCM